MQKWQLRALSGANAGYFGPEVDVPVTVSASATPQYGASVVSQTLPSLMTAGKVYSFTIAMQNAGSASWSGSSFGLRSVNSPANLWQTTLTSLGAAETVAPGGSRTFTFNVRAPATAGTYSSNWGMVQSGGVGGFGPTATTGGLVVTLCGNSAMDAGETCDDGNLVNGDGCSDHCQTE